jgi:hypothetical protein
MRAVLTALDDAVIGSRRNQQPHNADHQPECEPVHVSHTSRKLFVAITEDSAQLDPSSICIPRISMRVSSRAILTFFDSSIGGRLRCG